MTARESIALTTLLRARTVTPVHYEGRRHFRQGRAQAEREFERAPEAVRRGVLWLPQGVATEITV